MYLRDSFYVLTRRWYVVVPLFVVLAFCVNLMVRATPYNYSSQASVVLLSPSVKSEVEPTASNPYLAFSGNLQATAAVLVRILTDEDAADKLVHDGATASYTIGPDPTTPGAPLLALETKDNNPAVVSRTMDALIVLLKSELKDQQTKAQAPANVLISAAVVSDMSPKRSGSAKKKVLAGGLVAALVLPLLTAFAVEGAAFRRGRRRAGVTDTTAAVPGGLPSRRIRRDDAEAASPPVPAEPVPAGRSSRYHEQATIRTRMGGAAVRGTRTDRAAVMPYERSGASGEPDPHDVSDAQDAWNGLVELDTSEFDSRMIPKR